MAYLVHRGKGQHRVIKEGRGLTKAQKKELRKARTINKLLLASTKGLTKLKMSAPYIKYLIANHREALTKFKMTEAYTNYLAGSF